MRQRSARQDLDAAIHSSVMNKEESEREKDELEREQRSPCSSRRSKYRER